MKEINKLSYRTFEELEEPFDKILWFELLIDGESVENISNDEKAIPYYDFIDNQEIDLPAFAQEDGTDKRSILAVCSCGNAGCGSLTGVVKKGEESVNLKISKYNLGEIVKTLEYWFARENYDSVIEEIKKKANKFDKQAKYKKEKL